jgi:hypothetical protein
MKKPAKTLTEVLFDTFETQRNIHYSEAASAFHSLLEMVEADVLENALKRAYGKRRTGGWFYEFHKSIRQVGMYTNCFQLNPDSLLTKAEKKELETLNAELQVVHKKMHDFEFNELRKTIIIPAETDPTYVQKQAEYEVAYKKKDRELWPKEKSTRRRELMREASNTEKVSINGKLDSVLWLLVHVDKDNTLHDTLKKTFEAFAEAKRKKKTVRKDKVRKKVKA